MFKKADRKSGDMIWMNIDSEMAGLEWQTLAKKKGAPLREGVLQMETLSNVVHGDSDNCLKLRDERGVVLMELEADGDVDGAKWAYALREAIVVLAGEFQASKKRKQGTRRLEGRWLEMQRKKAAAESYKKSLGNTGMNYTARIMMERGSN